MKPSDFDLHLVELQRKSVGRLLSAEIFDATAFAELKTYLCEKAELIKSEHVVSKQVIACLLEAAGAIEGRVDWVPGAKTNANLVAEFHVILGQIAIGQGCNERKSGVPRVA